jgi:hypothetical protein
MTCTTLVTDDALYSHFGRQHGDVRKGLLSTSRLKHSETVGSKCRSVAVAYTRS